MPKLRSVAKQAINLSLGSIILTSLALAAPSVATVTSAVPFVLDGHVVSSPGVVSYPVVAGDTVATSNGPAVLLFHDGSTVKLSENSSAKLDLVGANAKVVLLTGALDYKLAQGSNLKVTNLDATSKDASTASVDSARVHSSLLSSPAFLVPAGGSAVGVASGLISAFSGSSTAATSAAASTSGSPMIAHIPPISVHL